MTLSISAASYEGVRPPERYNYVAALLRDIPDPNKTALIFARDGDSASGDDPWTYGRLTSGVYAVMNLFRRAGISPGQRVLCRMSNSAAYALALLATAGIGAVAVPVASGLSAREVEFIANDSDVSAIVASEGLDCGSAADGRIAILDGDILKAAADADGAAAPFAETAANDPAYQIYTSGSTGQPKGVVHAHRAIWGRRPMYDGWYGMSNKDVLLHSGALNWTYAKGTGLIDPLVNRATSVLYSGAPDFSVWSKLSRRFGATIFASVPGIYRKLVDLGLDMGPDFRHFLTAGEAMMPELMEALHKASGAGVYEAFGMSEISTYISTPPGDAPRKGSPGRPQNGRAVALLPIEGGEQPVPLGEKGIISVHNSDPGLMHGYWRRPDESAEAMRGDWFLTGDLAVMDEDGFIYPQGRADNVINAMGYRVSPEEIEAALESLPGVSEAAALAYQPKSGVSIVAALIVPKPGAQLSAEAIQRDAAKLLATYKQPKRIVFLDGLPRSANGKILRHKAAELLNNSS